jgi:hypothetical protein
MNALPDAHTHSHSGHHHDHSRDYGHHHGDGHHHSHSHGPMSPHPPSVLPVSLLRWSLVSRLGVAVVATVALWGVVLLAMR